MASLEESGAGGGACDRQLRKEVEIEHQAFFGCQNLSPTIKYKNLWEITLKHAKFYCIDVYTKPYPSTDHIIDYSYPLLLFQPLRKLGKFTSDKMSLGGRYWISWSSQDIWGKFRSHPIHESSYCGLESLKVKKNADKAKSRYWWQFLLQWEISCVKLYLLAACALSFPLTTILQRGFLFLYLVNDKSVIGI